MADTKNPTTELLRRRVREIEVKIRRTRDRDEKKQLVYDKAILKQLLVHRLIFLNQI